MALVVETGQAGADSESYASEDVADAYLAARGYAAWDPLSSAVKEQNLRKATEFLIQRYRLAWAGQRKTTTQALDWPRVWVPLPDAPVGYGSFSAYVPDTVVPIEVMRATVELAYRASQGTELNPDVGPQVQHEQIGPISTSYFQGSRQVDLFRAVDDLLEPLLHNRGSSIPIGRA